MHYAEKKKQERKKSVKRRQHQEHHKATHWSAFGKKKNSSSHNFAASSRVKIFFIHRNANERVCTAHWWRRRLIAIYCRAHRNPECDGCTKHMRSLTNEQSTHSKSSLNSALSFCWARAWGEDTQTQKTGFAVLNSTVFCAFCSFFCFSAFTVHSHSSEYAFRFDIYTAKECSMSVWNLYISRRNEDGRWELNASEKEKMANKKKAPKKKKENNVERKVVSRAREMARSEI